MECRAERIGTLPPAGRPIDMAGVRLPAGRLVKPDPEFSSGPCEFSALWMGPRPTPQGRTLWRELAARFAQTGLWPLLLTTLDDEGKRPWSSGELDPAAAADPATLVVADVLAADWAEWVGAAEGEPARKHLAPFGPEFPGLAPANAGEEDASAWDEALDGVEPDAALGLVSASRPADVLATIGWQGAVNVCPDAGRLSAVLRSWEDRFGAYLVAVGFDTLVLAVTRPVRPMRIARVLAAEQYAMCPDLVEQGADTIERLAEQLQHARAWAFWWD